MKIGLIKEGKVPSDRRVALTPAQCQEFLNKFPGNSLVVEKSPLRCIKDSEYKAAGIPLVESVEDCDILLGIKEVPLDDIIPHKTYLFFSHTIKKQAYNRSLLITALNKKITLIDYEPLVDEKGARVIAFGRFAGLVGAYNGLRAYGIRSAKFELKPAYQCFDLVEMKKELAKVSLPPIKIVVTGGGRVSKGAMEILEEAKVKKVSPKELLNNDFPTAVYAQLNPKDYNKRKDGKRFMIEDFYKNPQAFEGNFLRFAEVAEILVAGAYWAPDAPVLFTREDARSVNFAIKLIADITCDIEGSIPSTKRASTIADPFYDYDPTGEQAVSAFTDKRHITVMAVDNLPNELPRDASEAFGQQLLKNVLPEMLEKKHSPMIERATICHDGILGEKYGYLQDFVDGKE